MANTHILVKRSTTTATPTNSSLQSGELAYSYSSNTAFIGNSDGVGVLKIGGVLYTAAIDAATTANTASTIVKRDVNGQFSGNLLGNSTSTSSLLYPQNFSVSSGDLNAPAVLFSGNNAIVLGANLNAVPGLSNNTVGSATSVPVIQYGANGRILSVTSAAISSTITVSGNTGTDTLTTGSTITVQGGATGINTTITGSAGSPVVTINTDNTVVRSNVALVGVQTIGTDLQVSGNLIVLGSQTIINSSTVATNDSMIQLANNNTTGDVVDIGFYGVLNNGTSNIITGLVRDAGSKNYYLFSNVAYSSTFGSSNVITSNLFTQANTATLYTNINAFSATAGNLTLTNALPVTSGGTGSATFTSGNLLIGNGTGALQPLANTGTAGTYGSASYNPVITTDVYGRVSGVANTQVVLDLTSTSVTNTLPFIRGGTGSTTYTTGQILVASATGFISLANTTYTATGSGATNSTITSLTVDAYGRTTAATYSSISGLTVAQGGTGFATATTNGITFGNGTSALGVTAAAGTSDQTWSNQILTVTNAGVPVWSTSLDGGQF